MCWVECRTPYEETAVFSHNSGVSASNYVLDNNVLKSVNFEWYVRREFVSLAKVALRVVSHSVNLVHVVKE